MLHFQPNDDSPEGRVGRSLVCDGKLDATGLDRARRLQADSDERLTSILTKLGLVSESDLANALGKETNLPVISEADFPREPLRLGELSARFLKSMLVLPLDESAERLRVVVADPFNDYIVESLGLITGKPIERAIAEPGAIESAIERLYEGDKLAVGADEATPLSPDDGAIDLDVGRLKDLASEEPVIRWVNRVIAGAVERRASDIHIEQFERRTSVRLRIDGALQDIDPPPHDLFAAVVSRIKIMAHLDIAERRLPQDGRFQMSIRGKSMDFRVSTIPTINGEGVVMRILDRESVSFEFADLGISKVTQAKLETLLARPHGIFLVTGPTGSGKTTTLYAALHRLRSRERKICTVEDPVEYQLDGVNQVQIKPSIDLTFSSVLRSFLRQDPDIILVGEIRDTETARIAVHAALTGHLVLSTLHTNDAASGITRMLDMEVEEYLLTSTLNGIAAQRLVRKLCVHCREESDILPDLAAQLGLTSQEEVGSQQIFHPRGCEACNDSGFRGRTSIVEILPISDSIRRLILQRVEAQQIHRQAVAEGMQTMFENGMQKVLAGETTVEEVLRVTKSG